MIKIKLTVLAVILTTAVHAQQWKMIGESEKEVYDNCRELFKTEDRFKSITYENENNMLMMKAELKGMEVAYSYAFENNRCSNFAIAIDDKYDHILQSAANERMIKVDINKWVTGNSFKQYYAKGVYSEGLYLLYYYDID